MTVLPKGVLPRYLYSVPAIVMALLLVAGAPLGEGLTDALAYRRQGMNSVHRHQPWVDWRWRSLERWRGKIEAWWPGLPHDVSGWLTGLLVRSRGQRGDRRALLAAAVHHHASWGAAM